MREIARIVHSIVRTLPSDLGVGALVASGLLLCSGALLLPGPSARAAEELPEIVVEGTGRPFRVAVQRFAPDAASASAVQPFYAELVNALDFAGGFETMDPKAFLEPVQTTDFDQPAIPCDNWRASGANILVQGQLVRPMGRSRQRVRYRAWDVDLCRLRGDASFVEASDDDLWLVARKLADEIVQRFSGRRGVAATQLAYVSNESGNKELYVMEATDGSRRRRVTNNGRTNLFPGWSSDASRLIYTSFRSGASDLWWLGRGREQGGRVLSLPEKYDRQEKFRGVFGPGDGQVTFVMHQDENTDIYVSETNGSGLRRLTEHKAIDISPSWSPDGKRMVFMSDRTGTPQLYLMDMDTGSERRLTYKGSYNATPEWSPTGEWIVYSARTGLANFDLYLIDPDSAYTVPLVLHPQVDKDPTWSPDGRKIAFASNRRGRFDIYVVDLDGKNPVRLTEDAGDNTSPSWATWLD